MGINERASKKNQSGHQLRGTALLQRTGVIMKTIIYLYIQLCLRRVSEEDRESTCLIDWFCYRLTLQPEASFSLMSSCQTGAFRQQTHLCNCLEELHWWTSSSQPFSTAGTWHPLISPCLHFGELAPLDSVSFRIFFQQRGWRVLLYLGGAHVPPAYLGVGR